MEKKALGPSPLREAATFPPQADHVLVVFFFIRGGPGGCVKAPRHPRVKVIYTIGNVLIESKFPSHILKN